MNDQLSFSNLDCQTQQQFRLLDIVSSTFIRIHCQILTRLISESTDLRDILSTYLSYPSSVPDEPILSKIPFKKDGYILLLTDRGFGLHALFIILNYLCTACHFHTRAVVKVGLKRWRSSRNSTLPSPFPYFFLSILSYYSLSPFSQQMCPSPATLDAASLTARIREFFLHGNLFRSQIAIHEFQRISDQIDLFLIYYDFLHGSIVLNITHELKEDRL